MFNLSAYCSHATVRWRHLVFEAQFVLNGEKEFEHEIFNDAMQCTYEVFKEIGYREDFSLPKIEKEPLFAHLTITIGEYTRLIRLMSQYMTDFSFYKYGPLEFRASQLAVSLLLHEATSDFKIPDDDVLSNALVFADKQYQYSYDILSGDLSEIMEALKEYRKNFE